MSLPHIIDIGFWVSIFCLLKSITTTITTKHNVNRITVYKRWLVVEESVVYFVAWAFLPLFFVIFVVVVDCCITAFHCGICKTYFDILRWIFVMSVSFFFCILLSLHSRKGFKDVSCIYSYAVSTLLFSYRIGFTYGIFFILNKNIKISILCRK